MFTFVLKTDILLSVVLLLSPPVIKQTVALLLSPRVIKQTCENFKISFVKYALTNNINLRQ